MNFWDRGLNNDSVASRKAIDYETDKFQKRVWSRLIDLQFCPIVQYIYNYPWKYRLYSISGALKGARRPSLRHQISSNEDWIKHFLSWNFCLLMITLKLSPFLSKSGAPLYPLPNVKLHLLENQHSHSFIFRTNRHYLTPQPKNISSSLSINFYAFKNETCW